MEIYLLADEITVKFFKMIGVEGEVVEDAEACLRRVEEIAQKEEVMILIGESLAKRRREALDELKQKYQSSTITAIPDAKEKDLEEENIDKLVKEAIGIKF